MNQRSEKWWEKKLGVSTSGKTDNYIEESCNPYEPTEYCILERLAQSGYITSDNHFLDYGCGLGRSLFFMASQVGCRASGIEYDYELCEAAIKNLEMSKLSEQYKKSIRIVCTDARTYHVLDEDRFYFFNPFDKEIMDKVMDKIIDAHKEKIYIILHNPVAADVIEAHGGKLTERLYDKVKSYWTNIYEIA